MNNPRMMARAGASWRRVVMSALMAAAPVCAAEPAGPAQESPGGALGWKPVPEGRYEPYRDGSIFMVASEPAKWAGALERATAWAGAAPSLEENPAEHVFRRLAWFEAAVLNATDAQTAARLKAESRALGATARGLRSLKADGREWRIRNLAGQLQQLEAKLGNWLADSPAERVALFRQSLEAFRPVDRAVIAARYGGEQRLAELIGLAREHQKLTAAYEAAQQDTTSPEAERKAALRKAGGALGYFYGYHGEERGYMEVLQDPDLAGELGGGGGVFIDHRSLDVPELALWTGEEEAAALLIEVYALPVQVNVSDGGRTAALARRLLVEGRLRPALIPWSLAEWPGESVNAQSARELAAVYDALKALFPKLDEAKDNNDWRRGGALANAAYALAAAGRGEEAAALLAKIGLDSSGLPYHARISEDAAAKIWDLVAGAAKGAQGWNNLQALAAAANRGAELAAYAERQARESAADTESGRLWRSRHGWALVAGEKIDEGLAVIEAALQARPAASEESWAQEWASSAARLVSLGKALGRVELADAWADKIAAALADPKGWAWKQDELFEALAKHRLQAGDAAAVEALLRKRAELGEKSKSRGRARLSLGGDEETRVDLRRTLTQLADVIGRQGRHAEVVALLAESPHWGATDLAEVLDSGGGVWRPLSLTAAESLHAVGRTDEAARILEALLVSRSGYDPAYALYMRVRGADAAVFFERLLQADRYEERPLIWLASLRLEAGDVAGAEATVQRAIATDPSDGEQPKGDRMRAYAVLREVALKRGDAAQAEFLAGVLAARRTRTTSRRRG